MESKQDRDKYIKKEIRTCDIIITIAVLLMIGTHMTTNFLIQLKSKETKADIESVVKVYEANPFAKLVFLSSDILQLVFKLLLPAFAIGLYLFYRRSVMKAKQDKMLFLMSLQLYSVIFLLIMFLNFLNDFSILAGLLARMYGG
jgi:hypothetical protein